MSRSSGCPPVSRPPVSPGFPRFPPVSPRFPIEANQQLGFDSDLRNYELPGAILQFFGLKAVRLMSNNPEKVEAVEKAGVQVVERVPCLADVLDTRLAYLRTKREKMGHLLEFDDL
jgi:GTP cyclohydrolase II